MPAPHCLRLGHKLPRLFLSAVDSPEVEQRARDPVAAAYTGERERAEHVGRSAPHGVKAVPACVRGDVLGPDFAHELDQSSVLALRHDAVVGDELNAQPSHGLVHVVARRNEGDPIPNGDELLLELCLDLREGLATRQACERREDVCFRELLERSKSKRQLRMATDGLPLARNILWRFLELAQEGVDVEAHVLMTESACNSERRREGCFDIGRGDKPHPISGEFSRPGLLEREQQLTRRVWSRTVVSHSSVPKLVPQDERELARRQSLDERAVQHDEGAPLARQREGVERRVRGHVDLGRLGDEELLAGRVDEREQVGCQRLGNAQRAGAQARLERPLRLGSLARSGRRESNGFVKREPQTRAELVMIERRFEYRRLGGARFTHVFSSTRRRRFSRPPARVRSS